MPLEQFRFPPFLLLLLRRMRHYRSIGSGGLDDDEDYQKTVGILMIWITMSKIRKVLNESFL